VHDGLRVNAFTIQGSNDLIHWHLQGYVFPARHQPWWAVHSTGHWPGARYWAPNLQYIRGRWVVYFAAQVNLNRVSLHPGAGAEVGAGTFAVGVAWSKNLFGGWQTKILHYRGEDNLWSSDPGLYGGAIDPGEVRDPRSGQRWLFWAEQPASVWSAKLSPDGLTLDRTVHMVLWVWNPGWDCNPADGHCTVEGPAAFYYDNRFYLFFSGASTRDASYAMGAAVSRDATSGFQRLPGPILRRGRVWIGPGGGQVPVPASDRWG
jgi:beta-xylosidase